MNIAFLGLGNMGGPMALNLHRAGHSVHAYDPSTAALERHAALGLKPAGSPSQACGAAEVVISMLPAGPQVQALYLGDGGLLAQLPSNALVIDCSTIDAATTLLVARAAAERGLGFLDAPVSGGTTGAMAGTLTFMVGGTAEHLERARPVLEAMGTNLFHAGAAGAGQSAKLCNNMLLGILMIGTCEALALGRANGLDPAVLSEIMRRSSGGNWALEKYNPVPGVQPHTPASHDYQGGFATDLMLKDLGLAMASAIEQRASTPLGGLARQLYAAHSLAGYGGQDFSSILRTLQRAD